MAGETLLVPRFFKHVVPNEAASKSAGRPIFDEMECVELRYPGNRQTVAIFPAHEAEPNATRLAAEGQSDLPNVRAGEPVTYAMVFAAQYKQFKAGDVQEMGGTPLSELPFLTEAKRRELKALNIYTAEQLASLDGTPLKQLGMNGREMKNQAQAFIDSASGSSAITSLAAEVEALRQQIADRDELLARVTSGKPEAPSELEDDTEDEPKEDEQDGSHFNTLSSSELKDWIKDATGESVRGNPSKATLVKMATEAEAKLQGDA